MSLLDDFIERFRSENYPGKRNETVNLDALAGEAQKHSLREFFLLPENYSFD